MVFDLNKGQRMALFSLLMSRPGGVLRSTLLGLLDEGRADRTRTFRRYISDLGDIPGAQLSTEEITGDIRYRLVLTHRPSRTQT